ncbi:secreted RxLR effector protein 161-like [Primulina eburnea]|uniref:secreted RxLR effector protein 161-like n=1 Tax=Primulina eburnea TaxID=1245227 RepID=UPI003C6C5E33
MCPNSEAEMMEMSRVLYASAVGSSMFAMICTRSDIAQAVEAVSRYMANREHWSTVKSILRYIKDYAGDPDKRKYTTGYMFTLVRGGVSWVSKQQTVVVLSTTEAEYMAATQVCNEAI